MLYTQKHRRIAHKSFEGMNRYASVHMNSNVTPYVPKEPRFRQSSFLVRRTKTGFKGEPFGTAHVSPRVYIAVVPDT